MLTPVEIQSKVFKSGGLGYDKKDVDAYMREVLRDFENLYRENMELKDKVSNLNDGIQYYKTIEKTLQKALVLAEKTAEETREAALKDAKRIEKEATVKANIMLADSQNELDKLHKRTVELLQQYEKFKAQFKSLAAAQIDLLDSGAYDINVQRLEAFSVLQPFETDNNQSRNSQIEVSEIVSDKNQNSKKQSHVADESSEFEFSDFEMDGQEEFDFVNLNENNQ